MIEPIIKRVTLPHNDKYYLYLTSDLHIDESDFDKEFFTEEFESAKERGARIYINGDVFSILLPGDRKRFTMSSVGGQKNVDALMNQAIDMAYENLKPYVNLIDGIGDGNHEAVVVKYHSFDPIKDLIARLNAIRDIEKYGRIVFMDYEGWIRFAFKKPNKSLAVYTIDVYYNHGQGGKAEVTRGTIDLQRRGHKNAHLIWLGHKHTRISMDLDPIEGISAQNKLYEKERRGIITGCYKKRHKIITQEQREKNGYSPEFSKERFRTSISKGGAFVTFRRRGKNGVLFRVAM